MKIIVPVLCIVYALLVVFTGKVLKFCSRPTPEVTPRGKENGR